MSDFTVPYSVLCNVLFETSQSLDLFVQEKYQHLPDEVISQIIAEIKKRFVPHFQQRLRQVHYKKSTFLEKFSSWLKGEFNISLANRNPESFCDSVCCGGRPTKKFEECSSRTKRHKIQKLRESFSQTLIDSAASSKTENNYKTFDPDTALALITQAKLSKYQYEVIRKATKDLGMSIFPSYNKILTAKKQCYPDNVCITETSAEVTLQNLLDHTTKRIFLTKLNLEIHNIKEHGLVLHSKWGCDGASGQSEFKQKFSDQNPNFSDANLFMTSVVPLEMTLANGYSVKIWTNTRPSSTRFCRALKFQFQKETPQLIRDEKSRVEQEIEELCDTIIHLGDNEINITHKLHFTMIDGKVAQAVTDTASCSNCVVCGAKPSEMNDFSKLDLKTPNQEALNLGMSTLHARIRCMEYILHLSYNLPFEAWRTTDATRSIREERKKQIQKDFFEKVGIKIDVVKQGSGTTNDGNTSRRFFGNPALTSEITKIDKELIYRLSVILETICCNFPVNAEKFGSYAEETAKLAISLYPWYYMPSSVHRILLHGKDIIQNAALPIGSLSEEAQECRNKEYKYYRIHHSRKCSRLATNEDVFHMTMISSDPYISFIRPEPKKKCIPLKQDTLDLLL